MSGNKRSASSCSVRTNRAPRALSGSSVAEIHFQRRRLDRILADSANEFESQGREVPTRGLGFVNWALHGRVRIEDNGALLVRARDRLNIDDNYGRNAM